MKITPTRARWLARAGVGAIRSLGRTWRIRRFGSEVPFDRYWLLAFLHGDMLMAAYEFRDTDSAIMISQHGDGELIAQVVQRLGYHTVRGSSTRGGARAALEMLRQHPGRAWGITPDGPRGPRGSVHEGVITLAGRSGRPIWPLGYAASNAKRLSSWDRFAIPAPFARIASWIGEPLLVHASLDAARRAELAMELQRRMHAANEQAAEALRLWRNGSPPAAAGRGGSEATAALHRELAASRALSGYDGGEAAAVGTEAGAGRGSEPGITAPGAMCKGSDADAFGACEARADRAAERDVRAD